MPSGSLVTTDSPVHIVNIAMTAISTIASIWLAYFCYNTRAPRTVAIKLIFGIALSDLLYSLSNLMSFFDSKDVAVLCKTEGFLREFSTLMTVFFSTSMALLVYKGSLFRAADDQAYFFRKAVKLSIILSFLISISPFILPKIHYSNWSLFCWIKYSSEDSDPTVQLLVLILYRFFPIITSIIITTVSYIRAIRNIKEAMEGHVAGEFLQVGKLLWYPAVLFIIFVPSCIDNIMHVYNPDSAIDVLDCIHIALTHSIGLANALVYGLQRLPKKPAPRPQRNTEYSMQVPFISGSMMSDVNNSVSEDLRKARIG